MKAMRAFVASGPGYQWPSSQGCPFSGASMPNKRTRCLPNFTVSPSETPKPCEVPVPLVSESVWANVDTAAVQSTPTRLSLARSATSDTDSQCLKLNREPGPNLQRADDRSASDHKLIIRQALDGCVSLKELAGGTVSCCS